MGAYVYIGMLFQKFATSDAKLFFAVTMALMGTYMNPTWAQFGAPDVTLYSTALLPHVTPPPPPSLQRKY